MTISNKGCCAKFATGPNGRFMTISSHFFANYIHISNKTEVQTFGLGAEIWLKSYPTNTKEGKNEENEKNQKKNQHYTN